MIVKFDHITYVDMRKNLHKLKIDRDNLKFKEISLRNPISKKMFMNEFQSDSDIYFIESNMSVEYILYDRVEKKTDIRVNGHTIYAKVELGMLRNVHETMILIGAKCIEDNMSRIIYNIKGVFDKCDFFLELQKVSDFEHVWLDSGGWQCPCLLIDSVSMLFERLNEGGVIVNFSSDMLTVNKRMLEIGFLQCEGLEPIIEFIAPKNGF